MSFGVLSARGTSVLAVLPAAAAAGVIASFGAACTELDGNEEFCGSSGALTVGGAGETMVENVALGLRGIAAITDPSVAGASSKTPATIRPIPTNSTRSFATAYR